MTPEQQAILKRARQRQIIAQAQARNAPPETNMIEQSMSGVNEGIAAFAGMPVDLLTGAINAGTGGINSIAGTNIPAIKDPVGGSGTFRDILAPTISETQPQTMAQRFGRRVGQEVGAMAIPGGAMMRGAKAPLALAGTEAASAVGAGLAGQASQEVAPGNEVADVIASMVGGFTPLAAGRMMRPKPKAPSLDDLRGRQSDAYAVVDQSQSQLTDDATATLQGRVADRAARDGVDPLLAPKATRTSDKIKSLMNPTISEVEKTRRLVGRDVAGSPDLTEQAIGMGMKDEITSYLDNLSPDDVTRGDPSATIASLREGRDMTRRIKKSEMVNDLTAKAERRAATSGTGGNEVNAIRQNLRRILDNPKLRRGYSKEELAQIDRIVRGSGAENALRLAGRLSPTGGALPLMGNMASIGMGASSGSPLGVAVGAAPMAIGSTSQAIAEAITRRNVDNLDAMVRNGGKVPGRGVNQTDIRAAIAALLAGAADSPEQLPQ